MAFLQFNQEEFELPQSDKPVGKSALEKGKYVGKIIETKTALSTFRDSNQNEEIFYVIWDVKGTKINQKFKLWNTKVNVRLNAQKKLSKLLDLLKIKLFKTENMIECETDALLGKECGLFIELFESANGNIYPFVDDFYKVDQETQDVPFIEDSIGF